MDPNSQPRISQPLSSRYLVEPPYRVSFVLLLLASLTISRQIIHAPFPHGGGATVVTGHPPELGLIAGGSLLVD